ncbi:hypothetical protein BLNAU_23964 [Blattamonas nauphoetae]|uniref:Uncharacterized protein n=1 Tax=Blattamonas nauphoetae TaxID=2049346 RepID=A0ABQ9WQU8_9EUKA|nr:hypothetical protein BLNAU_23964 [Blattamonas nauphoetae]
MRPPSFSQFTRVVHWSRFIASAQIQTLGIPISGRIDRENDEAILVRCVRNHVEDPVAEAEGRPEELEESMQTAPSDKMNRRIIPSA